MMPIALQYWKSPVGELILGSFDNTLCLADWRYRTKRTRIDTRLQQALQTTFVFQDTPILQQTRLQLQEYFDLKRQTFELPLLMVGTPFQKQVWQALLALPFGSTASYAQLATAIGNPKAVRAVANANGANAISIIIPCHRIIGTDGKLVGYAGGVQTKQYLLSIEAPSLFTDSPHYR